MTARPSAEDCVTDAGNVVDRWGNIISDYEYGGKYTLGEFKVAMNNLLTSPELINCLQNGTGGDTVAHRAVNINSSIDGAKWAVSKGIDLTITDILNNTGWTAYDLARIFALEEVMESLNFSPERRARAVKLPAILKPSPAPATKSCAEVDGQTLDKQYPLPLHEYCIVAENVQSSRRIPIGTDMEKRLAGGSDYKYEAHRSLSGTGLYPGWKAVITFTCSSQAKSGCGYADYVIPSNFTPEYVKIWKPVFEARWGLNVHCGQSADLLGLDRDLEPGESVSVTQASDTNRSSPMYMDCRANALDPFTLSIKTTRLAR